MTTGKIIIATDSSISIQSRDDITDAIGKCFGAKGLILTDADLSEDFFDLRSGFAGELLQKFVNYQIRVAIILPDPSIYGARFAELAYEHSTHPIVRFVNSMESAKTWLDKSG